MIVNIDNELIRLKRRGDETPEYCPFMVMIWQTKRSRNPICARFKTLDEAKGFVETVTGLAAIRYVTNNYSYDSGQLYAFTGAHVSEYQNTEYRALSA